MEKVIEADNLWNGLKFWQKLLLCPIYFSIVFVRYWDNRWNVKFEKIGDENNEKEFIV